MTDLGKTITPKSDQLNADDLTTEPRTIRVTKVSANPGSAEQPISIYFEGDEGKPWKPCKSMRRVLVQVWGRDGAGYVGRSMTLFRDPNVQFGGVAVGGIRISHMSDIDRPVSLILTASRASRKPYTVDPLKPDAAPVPSNGRTLRDRVDKVKAALAKSPKEADLGALWTKADELKMTLHEEAPELEKELNAYYVDQLKRVGART